jgi:hypothetical protein
MGVGAAVVIANWVALASLWEAPTFFYSDVLKFYSNYIFLAMKSYSNHEHVYPIHFYKNV